MLVAWRSTGFVVALLALAVAPAAHAAEVHVQSDTVDLPHGGVEYVRVAVLTGESGEANNVTATGDRSSGVTVQDRGAPVRAGDGCAPIDPSSVRCASPLYALDADLGDGNDRFDATGTTLARTVNGRAGDDTMIGSTTHMNGGAGNDSLLGGNGIQYLDGGLGKDVLRGGGGSDYLDDGDASLGADSPSPDVLDGGAGFDRVDYSRRHDGLHVDMALGVAGEPGEGDVLSAVEDVITGSGDDELEGSERNDSLFSGDKGRDVIRGHGGNDHLLGGIRIEGGAGDDYIASTDRGFGGGGDDGLDDVRTASCGPGHDLGYVRRGGFLAPDCEVGKVEGGIAFRVALPLRSLRKPLAALYLRCSHFMLPRGCDVSLTAATVGGRRLGRAALHIPRLRRALLRLRLNRSGRTLLRRVQRLRVRISARTVKPEEGVVSRRYWYDRESLITILRLPHRSG